MTNINKDNLIDSLKSLLHDDLIYNIEYDCYTLIYGKRSTGFKIINKDGGTKYETSHGLETESPQKFYTLLKTISEL